MSTEILSYRQHGTIIPDVSNPSDCAHYLTGLFEELSDDLSDHQSRAVEEEYFRAHLLRQSRLAVKPTSSTPGKPIDKIRSAGSRRSRDETEETKEVPTKTCAGYFGK